MCYSEWAAPTVLRPFINVKPDNSIRVCGEEKFSKVDLSRAHKQILLDEDSREYVTINT